MPASFFQEVVCEVLGGGSSLLLGGGPLLAWVSISGFGSDLLRSTDFMVVVSLLLWGILEVVFDFVDDACFYSLLFGIVVVFVLCCVLLSFKDWWYRI